MRSQYFEVLLETMEHTLYNYYTYHYAEQTKDLHFSVIFENPLNFD